MNPRILIALPARENVKTKTAVALANCMAFTAGHGINVGISNVDTPFVSWSRCELVAEARRIKATHIFYIDSDMVFQRDIILRLLSWDKDFVCVDASRRAFPIMNVCKGLDGELIDHEKGLDDLQEISLGNTACTLIDMKVFDNIAEPYFEVIFDHEKKQYKGEDYYFCQKLRDAGYKLYCDTTIRVGHEGCYTFVLNTKEASNE